MPNKSDKRVAPKANEDLVEVSSSETRIDCSDDLLSLLKAAISRIERGLKEKLETYDSALAALESDQEIQAALKLVVDEAERTKSQDAEPKPLTADQTAVQKGMAKARRQRLNKVAKSLGVILVNRKPVVEKKTPEKVQFGVGGPYIQSEPNRKKAEQISKEIMRELAEDERKKKEHHSESETESARTRNSNSTASESSVKTAITTFPKSPSKVSSRSESLESINKKEQGPSNSVSNADLVPNNNSNYITPAMRAESARLIHTMRRRPIRKTDGFNNEEEFRAALRHFIYGEIRETMSYLGETKTNPAKPEMTLHGEQFDLHFYPTNEYERQIFPEETLHGCSWCYKRNTIRHMTTRCECLHDHQKRLILLLGWRCWGCLEFRHSIEFCKRFANKRCSNKSCNSPHHSDWTHYHAKAIWDCLKIETQDEAAHRCRVLRFDIRQEALR